MEQLWERSREGRKETNRKPSTGSRKERLETGATEGGKRGSESGIGNCGSHCEAEAGVTERKKQRLSKRIREGSLRDQAERAEENREARAELSTGEATVRRKREGLKGRTEG